MQMHILKGKMECTFLINPIPTKLKGKMERTFIINPILTKLKGNMERTSLFNPTLTKQYHTLRSSIPIHIPSTIMGHKLVQGVANYISMVHDDIEVSIGSNPQYNAMQCNAMHPR